MAQMVCTFWVGVQMTGPDTVVQAALPLSLEFVYGAAILMAEPETWVRDRLRP